VRFFVCGLSGLGLILLLVPFLLTAQTSPNSPDPAISSLRPLIRDSGYIFEGTVLSVQRSADIEPGTAAAVQISFRVERAVRGVRAGQVLTIREWAGLWNSGDRYRSGERLLLFLYPPGKLGLTSPVGGPMGRFSVDSKGNVVLENQRLAAISPDPLPQTIPPRTRRVSTRTVALAIHRMAAE